MSVKIASDLSFNSLSFQKFFTGVADATVVVQKFLTTGTWTCPTGVTSIECLVVAGGGGGGGSPATGSQYAGGAGGGGGGFRLNPSLSVVAGAEYTITVGAGGTGYATSRKGEN